MKKISNKKFELEGKRVIFFQIGIIFTLLFVLYAFEYKSYEKYELPEYADRFICIESEIIIPTKHEKKLPGPPPPKIVFIEDKSDDQVDADIFFDVDTDQDTPVEYWIPKSEPEPEIDDVYFVTIPGEMPSFPGGINEMMRFLSNNIHYPQLAKEVGITGIVYVEFIVEKDGAISNIILVKEIGGGCDEEAVRVVSLMPGWEPGKQNGIPVRVKLTLPVKFSLIR